MERRPPLAHRPTKCNHSSEWQHLISFCIQAGRQKKVKIEWDLSLVNTLTVDFLENDPTSCICIILLTDRRTDKQTQVIT